MKCAIVGYGFVGHSTEVLLNEIGVEEIVMHDPAKDLVIDDWSNIDLAFICVPTPYHSGCLDHSFVFNALGSVPNEVHKVVRSTIGPDWADDPKFKGVTFMPEFIREKHWREDVYDQSRPTIIGTDSVKEVGDLINLLNKKDRRVQLTTRKHAAMAKMTINSFLATKVAFANQIYDICKEHDMDYNIVLDLIQADIRMGKSHWMVPGPDGQVGYGGTCLPKDTRHMLSMEPTSQLLNAVVKYDSISED